MYLKIENSKVETGTLIKHRQKDIYIPCKSLKFGMETTQYYFSFSSLVKQERPFWKLSDLV